MRVKKEIGKIRLEVNSKKKKIYLIKQYFSTDGKQSVEFEEEYGTREGSILNMLQSADLINEDTRYILKKFKPLKTAVHDIDFLYGGETAIDKPRYTPEVWIEIFEKILKDLEKDMTYKDKLKIILMHMFPYAYQDTLRGWCESFRDLIYYSEPQSMHAVPNEADMLLVPDKKNNTKAYYLKIYSNYPHNILDILEYNLSDVSGKTFKQINKIAPNTVLYRGNFKEAYEVLDSIKEGHLRKNNGDYLFHNPFKLFLP